MHQSASNVLNTNNTNNTNLRGWRGRLSLSLARATVVEAARSVPLFVIVVAGTGAAVLTCLWVTTAIDAERDGPRRCGEEVNGSCGSRDGLQKAGSLLSQVGHLVRTAHRCK